jgi:hypothetical protein
MGDAARLKAGAQGGTAGVAAYDQAASTVKANQASAIKGLKSDLAGVDAPGRLLGSLSAQVRAPGQVALANLADEGAAAGFAQQQETSGTQNYLTEANASLGQIRGEADKALAQQLAMLNASRAGSGGGGGGGGISSMSDSELRNRLMGLARAKREAMFADAQKQYQDELAHAKATLAYPTANSKYEQMKTALPGAQQNLSPEMYDRLLARRREIFQTQHSSAVQRDQALQHMQIKAYGPGIASEAQLIGLESGLDPATVYGLIGPKEERAYLQQNEKLGLYKDPNAQRSTYSKSALDPYAAGRQLIGGEKLSSADIGKSVNLTAFDWNGDNELINAYKSWLKDAGLSLADDSPQTRAQFEKTPGASHYAKNVVQEIVNDAKDHAGNGWDFQTWYRALQGNPSFQLYPREYALAATMAQPLFSAAQVSNTARVPTYLGG